MLKINTREVIVFGAGKCGVSLVKLLMHYDYKVRACFDNDEKKAGVYLWNSVPVMTPKMIDSDITVVICFYKSEIYQDIKKQCDALGYKYVVEISPEDLQIEINRLPDKEYLEIIWKERMGEYLDLDNPKSFNEKLQWLKLYDHNPLYHVLVDKYEVKKYISETIGDKYVIPTLGVWNKIEEIDFTSLPNEFVLKCTHDSGSVEIINGKTDIDKERLKDKFDVLLKRDYYLLYREWSYKGLVPRIIAEKMIDVPENIRDYKFFVFNGVVKIIQVDIDRFSEHKRIIYSRNWEYLPVMLQYPTDKSLIEKKPEQLEEAVLLAEKLGSSIPQVRIDFYFVSGRIYFGEMTFYHGAGFEMVYPPEWNLKMGSWIKL